MKLKHAASARKLMLLKSQASPVKDPIISRNPFWLKDDAWKEMRSDLAPSMTPVKLKPMYPLILEGTKNLVQYIKRQCSNNEHKALDARNVLTRYTCDTVVDCLFGVDAQSFQSENPYLLDKANKFIRGIANSVVSFFPGKIMSNEVEKCFIDVTSEAIKLREASKSDRNDFLYHIISLKDKKRVDDLDAAGYTATIFLDGYETTAITLYYIFYELAKSKRIQEKLRKEIVENFDINAPLPYDLLLELPYLDQVFYEALRLHPPIPFTTRVCSESIDVEGIKDHKLAIEKDSTVWIPIRSIHRDPGNEVEKTVGLLKP